MFDMTHNKQEILNAFDDLNIPDKNSSISGGYINQTLDVMIGNIRDAQ